MVFTSEMQEAVSFLKKKKDYAIFAGFASEIHTGIESSADIDIYLNSSVEIDEYESYFSKLNWHKTQDLTDGKDFRFITLEKNKTTLDLYTAKYIREVIIPRKVIVNYLDAKLFVICKEQLFIERLGGVLNPERAESKLARDRKVIEILRSQINVNLMKEIITLLPNSIWTGNWNEN